MRLKQKLEILVSGGLKYILKYIAICDLIKYLSDYFKQIPSNNMFKKRIELAMKKRNVRAKR